MILTFGKNSNGKAVPLVMAGAMVMYSAVAVEAVPWTPTVGTSGPAYVMIQSLKSANIVVQDVDMAYVVVQSAKTAHFRGYE